VLVLVRGVIRPAPPGRGCPAAGPRGSG
jgi:hypothetical protein